MSAWLSFALAALGLGLLSLSMKRHAGLLPGFAGRAATTTTGKAALRSLGAGGVTASCLVHVAVDPQLGWIYWSGELMAATLLIAAIHAHAARRAERRPDLPRRRDAD